MDIGSECYSKLINGGKKLNNKLQVSILYELKSSMWSYKKKEGFFKHICAN